MSLPNHYIEKLKKRVLDSDSNLEVINDIDIIKIIDYSFENLQLIKDLTSNYKIQALIQLPNEKLTNHDIIVISFYDGLRRKYLASFYDNDELWQDPELIEIYHLQ